MSKNSRRVDYNTALNTINKQVPAKKNHIKCNQSAFVTKEVRKAIITQKSNLLVKKQRNISRHTTQRNFWRNFG